MSALYLITGFLGAGKTTFLKNFIRLFSGQRIQLIVNEFGKEGVDGALLADLGAYLREISGGSVFCACRMDQFEKVLGDSAAEKPDVILVEASGLSDPTGVRRLFSQTDRFPHIQYRGAVCLHGRGAVSQALRHRPGLYPEAGGQRCGPGEQGRFSPARTAGGNPDADPQSAAGYAGGGNRLWADPAGFPGASGRGAGGDRSTLPLVEDLSVRRITLRISETISVYELTMFIRMFSEQSFRVKGFLLTRDQGTVLADCVGTAVSVVPYSAEVPRQRLGVLTVLSGSKMPVRSAVTDACKWYAQYIISIEF